MNDIIENPVPPADLIPPADLVSPVDLIRSADLVPPAAIHIYVSTAAGKIFFSFLLFCLEKLDSVDNKRQYIIQLIRADISKEKTRE